MRSATVDLNKLPGTGAVARRLGVSERRVQDVLRSTPGLNPPIVAGKRRWRAEDVRQLQVRLAELARPSQAQAAE